MRRVKIVLLAGLSLVAVAIVVTLLQSPLSVASTNGIANNQTAIGSSIHAARYCQANERVPHGTSAIRISLSAAAGPSVSVVAYAHGQPITSGARGPIWIGDSVTVPVKPMSRTRTGVTVCVSFRVHDETVLALGSTTARDIAAYAGAHKLSGRMRVEYLHPGARSWAVLAPEIARHMGLGRAPGGTWIVVLPILLLAGAAALASRLVLRDLP
jgi:hypothetical protein